MGKDVKVRLKNLAARRAESSKNLALDSVRVGYEYAPLEEKYQKRSSKENSKYTLGAMQEVEPKYTAISLSEADRVKVQLKSGFSILGIAVDFKIQGSVAANLHIKGSSDVDMLLLDDRFYTYDAEGSKATSNKYTSPYKGKGPVDSLKELRTEALKILRNKYPEATVDAGAKAICISGGSLRRDIDVVPSHLHETTTYQSSLQEHFMGVFILNNDDATRVFNQPFLHIHLINEKDKAANGSLKKSIRLCKNIKQDAKEEGNVIEISSFDIAAIMWHSNLHIWGFSAQRELAILGETARHLVFLNTHREYARTLEVPDGSRKIFDSDAKFVHLDKLTSEVTDLAIEVATEQGAMRDWAHVQKILQEATVA